MLFNSPIYFFIFLPLVLLLYFLLSRYRMTVAAKVWLVLASIFFYGYWNPEYVLIIIVSILFNFAVGSALQDESQDQNSSRKKLVSKELILYIGISFNLLVLGYFKYTDFLITIVNDVTENNFQPINILLPLAISFFTFQQIAYLVDSYNKVVEEYDFLNYCLFVTFFPQLIAGPIVHHKEMMPQFKRTRNFIFDANNVAKGILLFSIGLFKKVAIADSFAIWANAGFDSNSTLGFFDAWGASLSYTFQLYYDFSGYSDMAIGVALMFNIHLPENFNSPYKALNIQDFWRRWHITLSRWLRDYVYIPLGGNRKGPSRAMLNSIITMLLGGIWHGAGWTFIVWGLLHGFAMAIHRIWKMTKIQLPKIISWLLLFNFINISWVFFRAENIDRAKSILSSMLGMNDMVVSERIAKSLANFGIDNYFTINTDYSSIYSRGTLNSIIVIILITLMARNSSQIIDNIKAYRIRHVLIVSSSLFIAIIAAISNKPSQFLYFNF